MSSDASNFEHILILVVNSKLKRMKFLWLWILIIFGFRIDVVWSEMYIQNNIVVDNQWRKIAKYLHEVMLNDDSMKKGYINLLIIDFTLNHDIDEIVEFLNENTMIIMNLFRNPAAFKYLKNHDFVIIIQDFMQMDFTQTYYVDDFQNKINKQIKNLQVNAKYYIINSINTKQWKFSSIVKFNAKCVNLFRTKGLDKLMFIDCYDFKHFTIIKHLLKNNLIYFKQQLPSNTYFSIPKMGDMRDKIIKIQQFDELPFSKVENGRVLGTAGRLLDTFCDRYNVSYTIINKNTSNLELKRFAKIMYTEIMDLNLNHILRINEILAFESIILNELIDRSLLIPRNIPLSAYDSFSYPFDGKISIYLFVASCFVIISWKAMSLVTKTNFNIDFIVFSVLCYLMGNSATLQNRMSYKEKFIVYGYVWASLVLLTLYESYVISFMMTDQSYRSVTSLNELNNSNTKIHEYFMDGIQFKENLIVHKMFLDVDNIILKMPDKVDVNQVYLVNNMYADVFVNSIRNYDKQGRRLFDKLIENIMPFVPTYIVNKSFPLKKELKYLIDALNESGIKSHWLEEMLSIQSNYKDELLSKNVVEVEEKIVLTFSDMKIPFIILGIGLSLSFVIFIIELKFKTKRFNQRLLTILHLK